MDTPLNASASTAGGLVSGSIFEVPPYQREYSWREDEVKEFFEDIQRSLDSNSYFLGLIILTDEDGRKKIVDGQQRVVTLTLLASALHHEAKRRGRSALADRVKADFLTSINYETDENDPRVILTDEADNATLQHIVATGDVPENISNDSVSEEIVKSYKFLKKELINDLKIDPFKRLGKWTEFITNKLYFAVFVHPTPSSAYQVFEVINTRGRDLTTADLLKNFIISQVPQPRRSEIYERWKRVSDSFANDGTNSFVQYIRHTVTVKSGHILPKDLFSFLASRAEHGARMAPSPLDLIQMLEENLPLYLQMVDPSLPGPADEVALSIFRALNRLNVIAVRPLMMAIIDAEDPDEGLRYLLRLVTRRIVTGNLGTGNIERRFSEAARKVSNSKQWNDSLYELIDLDPEKQYFIDRIKKRSLNKNVMNFIKNSIISSEIAPDTYYHMHYIIPKSLKNHPSFSEGELSFWGGTIGNTFLSLEEKRADSGDDWNNFLEKMIPVAAPGELVEELEKFNDWTPESIQMIGAILAERAAEVWYG
ncbi:DUF262 domain-containing protein [Agrobacterium salinitolerans]|uniref:DUF262 domain-containing protein n=1 Tax=Agrobacterium salinitolerans TaxID=1183413 RepID=UPI0022B8453C|nr:DUF262 domain-containing protein [Agrobacterium salinitolerans]MCZ7858966.1 DUF262 domain-containing protein [Agrobacterium salinitolerans]